MIATTTSNCSILLTRICRSFPLSVFYRSSAEYLYKNTQWICLSKPACLHIQQPGGFVSTYYAGRVAYGCYALPKGNPWFFFWHCLFSIFATNLHTWRSSPIRKLGNPWMGVIITTPSSYYHHTTLSVLKISQFRFT